MGQVSDWAANAGLLRTRPLRVEPADIVDRPAKETELALLRRLAPHVDSSSASVHSSACMNSKLRRRSCPAAASAPELEAIRQQQLDAKPRSGGDTGRVLEGRGGRRRIVLSSRERRVAIEVARSGMLPETASSWSAVLQRQRQRLVPATHLGA